MPEPPQRDATEDGSKVVTVAEIAGPGAIQHIWITVPPRYWQMPFRRSARVTVENPADELAEGFFYQITYTLTGVPGDAAYLHARWNRSNPVADGVHTLLDGVAGRGHYVGTYLAWGSNTSGWWGEGEIKFYLDGDTDHPTICGTGTEDYFGWHNAYAGEMRYLLVQDDEPHAPFGAAPTPGQVEVV